MRRFLCWGICSLALAACSGHRGHGPAWPKSAGTVAGSDWTEDGGEPLTPRTPAAAAVERSSDSDDKPAAEPTSEATAAEVAPAEVPTAMPPELPIELLDEGDVEEEIIIEIED